MMTTLTPDRSLEQRRLALNGANQTRFDRAALKQDIAAGDVKAADVLAAPPACAQTMKVYDLLRAIPWWGEVKALSMLTRCQVSPAKRIGGLTPRQRSLLVESLQAGAPVPTGPRRTPRRSRPEHHCSRCEVFMPAATPERICGFCVGELGAGRDDRGGRAEMIVEDVL